MRLAYESLRFIRISVCKIPHTVGSCGITFKEIYIIGTRVYTHPDSLEALQITPDLPYEDLILQRVELDRGAEGFDMMGMAADACKVTIKAD